MMAAWFKGPEEDPGSEEEEEGLWEYDSTWEDDGEEEEDGRGEGYLEEGEKQKRKESEAAAAAVDTQEPEKTEKPRRPRRGQSPSAKQERRRPNRSAMSFGRYKSASRRNWMAAKDMQRYRHHYPDLEETDTETREDEMWNLSFYKNEISFVPRGLHIEDLLETWQHDYAVMEENHSYIQWLFPLREQGMNWRAKLLTCNEIQAFRRCKEVMDRFVRAYKLMLGFYGIELINEETGELRRADNYLERFWNLNQYTHNNLRITRILKCLGEMGKEHYQVHLVKFFLTETLVHRELQRVMRSALDYFMFTVRNKQKRRELVHFAWQHYEPKYEFVWGPRRKLLEFKSRSPELLNNLTPKGEEEPAKDGEGVERDKSQSPNEIDVVGNAADRTNHNVKEQPDSDGYAAEPQSRPLSEHKGSEKTEELSPGSAADVKAEEDVKEDFPSGKPDGKDPFGDCGSSICGTDSEYLKESKKRKFETNRPSRESVGLSRSPTDIEKISSNLEEVVIDQEGPESLPLTEKSKPPTQEGNGRDGQDLKEADLIAAVVKRRKVDEMAADESVAKTAAPPDAEGTSLESQIPSFKVPSPEKTAEVCPSEVEISNSVTSEAQSDCRTAGGLDVSVNLETGTANLGCPSGDSVPDTSSERVATSTIGGERSQACSALIAGTRQEEGGSGEEEAGTKGKAEDAVSLDGTAKATESAAPLAEPGTERNPR
uniref:opioid growth factor receptor n=1 Tax=Euleptes europaea TaxID=460621 RepID=UPI00254042BF|nr:opioid growth factor receptor [Euleptes europaea]